MGFFFPTLHFVNTSLARAPSCCGELSGRDRKSGANGERGEYQPVIYFHYFWNVTIKWYERCALMDGSALALERPFQSQTLQRSPHVQQTHTHRDIPSAIYPQHSSYGSTVPCFPNSFLISVIACSCTQKEDTFSYLKSRHKKSGF